MVASCLHRKELANGIQAVALTLLITTALSLPPSLPPSTDVIGGKGLQLFLLHEDVSMQYYIPAVAR